MAIQYERIRLIEKPLQGGVGNETQFAIGNPYRRIRKDSYGLFLLVKGERVSIEDYFAKGLHYND